MLASSAHTVIVFDFETTGLSPNLGDRPIEIGAVRLEEGTVTARFQQLMNPGFSISSFIESYTGISRQMLRKAPPCEEVMAAFAGFIGEANLVAHNAAFDQRFLDAELNRLGLTHGDITCSMLVARRLYPQAPNHQLGSLVRYCRLPAEAVFHRALADSEMTARLWLHMLADLHTQHGVSTPSFQQLCQLARKPKKAVPAYLARCRAC